VRAATVDAAEEAAEATVVMVEDAAARARLAALERPEVTDAASQPLFVGGSLTCSSLGALSSFSDT
jgi:hypothetical protein